MFRILYILAEFVTLYLIVAVLGLGLIWLTMGLKDWGAIIAIVFLVATIPWSLKAVTVGPRRHKWLGRRSTEWALFGAYKPIRPLAFIMPTVWASKVEKPIARGGNREAIEFRYEGIGAPDAFDVIEALANELTAMGITCTRAGYLSVKDGATQWQLEPVLGEPKLQGWIQSDDVRDRDQTRQAIREFLVGKLKLTLLE